MRQTGLSAGRNGYHGCAEERAATPLQGAETDQRDHVRSHLQSDRESDAVLLITRGDPKRRHSLRRITDERLNEVIPLARSHAPDLHRHP